MPSTVFTLFLLLLLPTTFGGGGDGVDADVSDLATATMHEDTHPDPVNPVVEARYGYVNHHSENGRRRNSPLPASMVKYAKYNPGVVDAGDDDKTRFKSNGQQGSLPSYMRSTPARRRLKPLRLQLSADLAEAFAGEMAGTNSWELATVTDSIGGGGSTSWRRYARLLSQLTRRTGLQLRDCDNGGQHQREQQQQMAATRALCVPIPQGTRHYHCDKWHRKGVQKERGCPSSLMVAGAVADMFCRRPWCLPELRRLLKIYTLYELGKTLIENQIDARRRRLKPSSHPNQGPSAGSAEQVDWNDRMDEAINDRAVQFCKRSRKQVLAAAKEKQHPSLYGTTTSGKKKLSAYRHYVQATDDISYSYIM